MLRSKQASLIGLLTEVSNRMLLRCTVLLCAAGIVIQTSYVSGQTTPTLRDTPPANEQEETWSSPSFSKKSRLEQHGDFNETFSNRQLDVLQCIGDVQWKPGVLRLPKDAVIGCPAQLWPFLTLDIEVLPTEAVGRILKIQFRPDGAPAVVVSLEQRGNTDTQSTTIRILSKTIGPGGKTISEITVREFHYDELAIDGKWSFDFRAGLVVVSHEDSERAVGFVEQAGLPVMGVSLISGKGDVDIANWRVRIPEHAADPNLTKYTPETVEMMRVQGEVMAAGGLGELRQALEKSIECLRLTEDYFGSDHQQVAASLTGVGNMHLMFQEYAEARKHLERALKIRQHRYGIDHPETASAHDSLGRFLLGVGDYVTAEEQYRESIRIYRRAFGETDRRVADALIQLARLESDDGRNANSRRWLEQALSNYVLDEKLEKNGLQPWRAFPHELRIHCLEELANHHDRIGETQLARERRQEALGLLHLATKSGKPFVGYLVESKILQFAIELGNYDEVIQVIRATQEEQQGDGAAGSRHRSYLTQALIAKGDFESAKKNLSMDLESNRQKHAQGMLPDSLLAGNLFEVAQLHVLDGKPSEAQPLFQEALDIKCESAGKLLSVLSTSEMLIAVREGWLMRDSILAHWRSSPMENSRSAYDAVWKTHGFATQALNNRWKTALLDPDTLDLRRELIELREKLARHVNQGVGESESWNERLRQLTLQKEQAERKLAAEVGVSSNHPSTLENFESSSAGFLASRDSQQIAIVHIVRVSGWDVSRGEDAEPPSYESFVLLPSNGKLLITWVPLGPAQTLETAVNRWRQQLASREDLGNGGKTNAGARVRELVWEPLEQHFDGRREIIIIPGDDLSRLPWPALPSEDGFLIEDYAIGTMSFPQQLLQIAGQASEKTTSGCLLLGGVNYDARDDAVLSDSFPSAQMQFMTRAGGSTQLSWPKLNGTLQEVNEVKRIWKKPGPQILLTGKTATENQLRSAIAGRRYVHLATHGFFADEHFRSAFSTPTNRAERLRHRSAAATQDALTRSPLTLSGIVTAGANIDRDHPNAADGDDGLLTAEEVMHLPLEGTELVVLSACETGLGRVAGGEGVQGLQRAFHMAGARAVIAGLWKVDDEATRLLMVDFYRNHWEDGLTKLQALRKAQLRMLRSYDPSAREWSDERGKIRPKRVAKTSPEERSKTLPPYYWAGFTLSGDWR